ncbi:hypothetical protein CerSpe_114920 [Prunus speciosa]
MLSWVPPRDGWFKLNIDGSRRFASGTIGAGGVIRNSNGDWIAGFAINLGTGQVLEAELWGLFFGIKLAVHKRLSHLNIEMDSSVAVNLMKKADFPQDHPLAGLLSGCLSLMRQIGNIELNHIYREQNSVADGLANWSYNLDLDYCDLDEPPAWITPAVLDDLLGVCKMRLVSIL